MTQAHACAPPRTFFMLRSSTRGSVGFAVGALLPLQPSPGAAPLHASLTNKEPQAGSYGRWTVNGFDKRSEERAGARQMCCCSALRGQRRSDERKTPSKSNVRAGRRAASLFLSLSRSASLLYNPSRVALALYCVKSVFESFTCVRFGSSYTLPFTQATRTRRRTEPQRQRAAAPLSPLGPA